MQTHPHSPTHTQHSREGHVASKPTHSTATFLTSSLGHPLIRPSTLPMLTHTTTPELLQPFWTWQSVMSSCVNGGHTQIKVMCRALLHERGYSPSLTCYCLLFSGSVSGPHGLSHFSSLSSLLHTSGCSCSELQWSHNRRPLLGTQGGLAT